MRTYGGIFHLFSACTAALYQLFFSLKILQILSGLSGGAVVHA
jgi:hypothetical protein